MHNLNKWEGKHGTDIQYRRTAITHSPTLTAGVV